MKIIVFDDDPTGSQTVHDCLLLLNWDYQTLLKGLKSKSKLLFILCNTRSLSEKELNNRLSSICNNLCEVINNEGFKNEHFIFVSRGDSTLRGHNFLEPIIINKFLGPFDATFHIPAFIEGKRLTIKGNHFVEEIPAHKTIFAKDKIFGFETNNLKKLLFQKSKFKLRLDKIKNLYTSELDLLEINEENQVFKKIKDLKDNTQVIVDAENYFYLNKFSTLVKKLKCEKKFLFRSAASFISSISKIEKNNKDNNYYSRLRRKNNANEFMKGLIVFGSHVDISTVQLKYLLKIPSCKGIEIDVNEFKKIHQLRENTNQLLNLKNKLLKEIKDLIKGDLTPVLYTSREVIYFKRIDDEFQFNEKLSLFIAELIFELKYEIGYLISKGGITSNTILSDGFNVKYAYLEGQIILGISLLTIYLPNIKEYLPVVTFPGNLGTKNTMVDVWNILENKII